MNGFLNLIPTIHIILENLFLHKTYPHEGSTLAVIDTGYEGFAAIPTEIFEQLSLNELQPQRRTLILANSSPLTSQGTYATLRVPGLHLRLDGFIETYGGLDEIIIGAEALGHFRITLDYRTKHLRLNECP